MELLVVKNLKKVYSARKKGNTVTALSDVSFSVESGEFVAIMGESGSGKSSLLNILASLDKPTSGEVFLDGMDITKIKEKDISNFRRDNLGFVFQDFNLLDTFNLKDNIFLPLVLANTRYEDMKKRLDVVSKQFEIRDILQKFPYEVSGGEKQRAAVCRALITNPKIILADEPTGALDSRATDKLLSCFRKINLEGNTILMVTHSTKAAASASRVLFIKDGEVYHQIYRGQITDGQMYEKINDTLVLMSKGSDINE